MDCLTRHERSGRSAFVLVTLLAGKSDLQAKGDGGGVGVEGEGRGRHEGVMEM